MLLITLTVWQLANKGNAGAEEVTHLNRIQPVWYHWYQFQPENPLTDIKIGKVVTYTCTQACTHTHTHSRQPILPMADTDTAMQREMKGGREGASEQAGRERKATRGGERSGMERREEEQRQRRHERGEWGRLERWEEERPSYENIRMKRQREGGGDVRGERQGRWTEWRVSPRDRGMLALCKCELCELKCEV